MVFSEPAFLYAFLPACLLVYWLGGWRVRNQFLIVVGTLFYLSGGRAQVLLLAASILLNHFTAVAIHKWRAPHARACRVLITTVVAANVGALVLWKYGSFLLRQTTGVLGSAGLEVNASLDLALPIAISFYTFQCISYLIDVWLGTARPAPRFVDFAAYILLFPHLIAGPIVRYADIEDDLLQVPRHRFADFVDGAPRFFWGLGKKVLIADHVAGIANIAFQLPDGRMTAGAAWVGAIAFAVQIYFDFSGYSDMAIGLARMFGFHFPENFNRPYSAVSMTDFWRRWHMSLSSWFRDYVYIPLGGNRSGPRRTYVNLAIVFLLTGMWHGAASTFLVWGCYHGACLIIERLTGTGATGPVRFAPARKALTFALVCIGWTWFRAISLGQGLRMTRLMVLPTDLSLPPVLEDAITNQRLTYLAIGLLVLFLPRQAHLGQWISAGNSRPAMVLRTVAVGMIAPVACMYALSSSFSPFLYFQF